MDLEDSPEQVLPLTAGLAMRDRPAPHHPEVVTVYFARQSHAAAQPVEGGPVTPTSITDALTFAEANGLRVIARQDFGRWAADWMKALGPGPVSITDPPGGGHESSLGTFAVPVWWSNPEFLAAHRDFATKEAEQLDGRIPAITFAPMMTLHAEPFLRQIGGNSGEARATRAALAEKGYEFAPEREAWMELLADHFAVWRRTRSILAFNPGQSRRGDVWESSDMSWTIEVMDHVARTYGDRIILYNCSLNVERARGGYAPMYERMKHWHAEGIPIGFQTSVARIIGDLDWAMDYAVAAGAHVLELPPGYETRTTHSKLAEVDAALRANA